MDEHCYLAKEPPAIERRGKYIYLVPSGSHCEVKCTPQTLQKFVARCNRILDEWHESKGGNVVRIGK